ncbi:Vacuolar protein-sorting-associated protein 36 [Dinochytrium kinnereticum]|nr:Vacuolar protein-sorting-associated protein 36 [Dinochytrium kinnereticum]
MKVVDEEKKQTDATLNEAFRDLDSLMAKASQMVKLAESISSKMAPSASSSMDSQLGGSSDQVAAFRSYLVELGISSPVTKEAAGNLYVRELSRELAEFLSKILNPRRTMIPLVDLYCMMNRARGVALISPSDLLSSTQHLQQLNLPFRLRKFDRSGLLVVERDVGGDGDLTVAERVLEVLRENPGFLDRGVNACEWAEVEGVSVVLAVEQLGIAESKGKVCRDDTIEGLRFFENRIMAFDINPDTALFKPGSRRVGDKSSSGE